MMTTGETRGEEEMRYAPVDSKLRTTPGGNDEREQREDGVGN